MALRPLDNALPIKTPERLKKPVKVAVISNQKKPDFAANDENRAQFPVPVADFTVDYIASELLKPIPDPETEFHSMVGGLESKDWLKVCDSLNTVRRIALHHSNLLLSNLEKVLLVLVKAMKSPRSALCKTSIMASSDIIRAFGNELLNFQSTESFDQMLLQLLLKASQDKRFVCEEADKALNAMVESISPLSLLHKLKVYVTHANLRVRAKAAISISHCVSQMELERMKEYGLVSLLQAAVDLLNDKLPEAREAARRIVTSMYKGFSEKEEEKQESWQNFCHSNLPIVHAQAMIKITLSL